MSLARIDDLGDRLVVVNLNSGRRGALTPDLYGCVMEAMGRAAVEAAHAIFPSSCRISIREVKAPKPA